MGKRNPNGYGSVTKLKGNRSKPWIIKVTQYDADGNGRQVPLDYAATEEEANIILAKYNHNPWNIDRKNITLADLYNQWSKIKKPKLGTSLQYSLQAAYKHCSKLYGMKYINIKSFDMQDAIDGVFSYSSQTHMKNLWGHLDDFAFERDIIDKKYSSIISVSAVPPDKQARTPFTDKQIEDLWKHRGETGADFMLLYLYTGFRLVELLGMKKDQVNLNELYFQSGVKTAAGKGRIVPIHSRIQPIVIELMDQPGNYLIAEDGKRIPKTRFYKIWKETLALIGIDPEDDTKTPHATRHTVETRLDNAHANKKCIDLIIGHKSKDIGNRVYNHKTLEQLRATIELLK
ncbi:tyrosine-type recombinase/integrase [Hominiventricola aquisgranensis]|uniref:Tyrosine-type recombinase/integrase n=1 Tax=Hominiventricola aquisgranensis TaxID=3133164 RepID=A0ABV1HYR8_9FIRM